MTSVVRDAVSSPHATMTELGRDVRAAMRHIEEHEQRHSFAPKIMTNRALNVRAEATVTKPTIAAPRVTAGFAASHELGYIPSDAAGAVSSKYLLHASNASVVAQDRAGVILSNVTLASFWHDPAFADGVLYDSRVLYDSVADRWVFCTLYDVNLHKSTLLVAVSDGGNPSLGWRRYRFTVDPADLGEADFTRKPQTRDAIAITANIFSDNDSSSPADIYVIRKSELYSGAATLKISQGHTPIYEVVPVEGPESAQLYMVHPNDYGTDLTLFNYDAAAFTLTALADLLAPSNTGNYLFDDIGPQRGSTTKLDLGFVVVSNAVLKNAMIWVACHVDRETPSRASILWWRIPLSNPQHADTGLIDDPTGATMYAFPSIAVNKYGAALIGYSVINESIYPSAGYSYIDPLNNLSTPALLKAGDAPSRYSRWVDFSATVVDANDIDFWTNQTYAPIGSYWATWWSKVEIPVPRGRAVRH